MTTKVRPRWVVLVIAVSVLLFGMLHYFADHSEGMAFLDQTIRNSKIVKSRIGDVQRIRFGFFDGYREKFVGSDKWMWTTVHAVGAKGEVSVKAAAEKRNGVWALSEAYIDGTPVILN